MGWPNAFTSCNNFFCCLAWICLKAISSFKVYGKSWYSHSQPQAGTESCEAKPEDASDQHWRKRAWCCFDFCLFFLLCIVCIVYTYIWSSVAYYRFLASLPSTFPSPDMQKDKTWCKAPVLVLRNQGWKTALQTHFHQQSTDLSEGGRT